MDNGQRPLMVPPWFRDLLVKAAQQLSLFDESKVARHAKGPKGGQFAPKGGGKSEQAAPPSAGGAEGE